jgi:hypothetical protein
MQGKPADRAGQRESPDVEFVATVTNIASRRIVRESSAYPRVRCVSAGYLSDGCSCRATIPNGVATDAWARELRAGVSGDRFFHFTWRSELWLAYGLKDGRVRGVYCPEHRAERERRSLSHGSSEEGARAAIALTG